MVTILVLSRRFPKEYELQIGLPLAAGGLPTGTVILSLTLVLVAVLIAMALLVARRGL